MTSPQRIHSQARPSHALHVRMAAMLTSLFVTGLLLFVVGLWSQQAQAQANKGNARDQRCYLTEQTVVGKNRQCVYRCDDGSAEGANTGREFSCPNVLFKPVKK